MDLQAQIRAKFEALLKEGGAILAKAGWNGRRFPQGCMPSDQESFRWRAEALNLLGQVCGEGSSQFKELLRSCNEKTTLSNGVYFPTWYGIVEATWRDFDGKFLNLRRLVRADVVDDFLTQAERLIEEGLHVPAVQLAGAILEDSLRKLCDQRSISYPAKTKIDALNSELAKTGVYDKLKQKTITAHADLRNTADHGHFDRVDPRDAKHMVAWVRQFVTDYLQ